MQSFRFPTVADILATHDELIAETGGTTGVLHRGAVEAAVERAVHGPFSGEGTLVRRVSLLLRGICQDHPFADGNKRTALVVSQTFLSTNGFEMVASQTEQVDFMLAVAQGALDIDGIEKWMANHTRKL